MKRAEPTTLREKLFHSFLPLMLVPLLVMSVVMSVMYSVFATRDVFDIKQMTSQQVLRNVDGYLDNLMYLTNYPYVDRDLLAILRKNYSGENDMLERMWDASTIRQKLAAHVYHMNNDLNGVFLIQTRTDAVFATLLWGNVYNLYDYHEADWYNTLIEAKGEAVILGLYHNELCPTIKSSFGIGKSILDPYTGEIIAVMLLNMKPDSILDLWAHTDDKGRDFIAVSDAEGRLYCQSELPMERAQMESVCRELITSDKRDSTYRMIDGQLYRVMVNRESSYGWSAVSFTPVWFLIQDLSLFWLGMIVVVLLTWGFLGKTSRRIAQKVTRPIEHLRDNMDQFAAGRLDVRAPEGVDEIGVLGHRFNHMGHHIQELIARTRVEERERSNAELLALQSQINPHFLYNTLNSIRVMAQLQGARRVAEMLEQLVGFLRSCSHSVQETVTLREEIEQSRRYLELMNFRHLGHIHYKIDLPPELENAQVLRFMLQPLLENAIVHGIDLTVGGNVLLLCRAVDDCLELRVADNGCGMTAAQCEQLLAEERNDRGALNVGVNNVCRRIRLLFGEGYGLSVRSRVHCYTVIIIRLPLRFDDPQPQQNIETSTGI